MDRSSRKFRQMLIKVGDHLKPEDIKTMVFYCKEFIPGKYHQQIVIPTDFFEELEKRGKLSKDNVHDLKTILTDTLRGRTDVLKVIQEYEEEAISFDIDGASSPEQVKVREFRHVSEFLEEKLGSRYKFFLRRLGLEDNQIETVETKYSGNVQEIVHQCISLWVRTNSHLQHCELLNTVICALKKEKRNDLAHQLEKGTFSGI